MSGSFDKPWGMQPMPRPRPTPEEWAKVLDEALDDVGASRIAPITITEARDERVVIETLVKTNSAKSTVTMTVC